MQEVLERKSIKNIDFNCDLGQSYGIYKNSNEFESFSQKQYSKTKIYIQSKNV